MYLLLRITNLYKNNNFIHKTRRVTNLNHLLKLKVLDALGWSCGLDDEGILNLNLSHLNISKNLNIRCLKHMSNLKELDASFSVINDRRIRDLKKITKLNMSGNQYIESLNHMVELTELDISNCPINENGIMFSCSLIIKIVIRNNKNIKSLNHLKNLKILIMKYGILMTGELKI